MVHVRYDSFVLNRERSQAPLFRMRLKPVPVEDLHAILQSFTPAVDPDSTYGFYLNFFRLPLLQHDFPGTLRRLQLEILKSHGPSVSIGAATFQNRSCRRISHGIPGSFRIIAPAPKLTSSQHFPSKSFTESRHNSSDLRSRGIATSPNCSACPAQHLRRSMATRSLPNLAQFRALDAITTPTPPAAQSRGAGSAMPPQPFILRSNFAPTASTRRTSSLVPQTSAQLALFLRFFLC